MKAGRPSLTARSVALGWAALDRPAGPHEDPEAEASLYRDIRLRLTIPQVLQARMDERTRFFDDETVRAIPDGTPQVVIIGAGCDGRALRFRDPAVRFFELDHPGTQSDKRRRLAALAASAEGITFASLDLNTDDLDATLQTAGHRSDRDSLFICEGLFAYLSIPVVVRVCTVLASRATPASVLAVNFRIFERHPALVGRARRDAVNAILWAIGERRGTEFHEGEPTDILARAGWLPERQAETRRTTDEGGSYGLLIASMLG